MSELFGIQSFDGWIEADASAAGLGIFVTTGSWDMQRLDASVARDVSSDFVLFHSGASAILVNPSARPANVTITEFTTGRMQSLTIPMHGRVAITLNGAARVQSSEALAAVERSSSGGRLAINAAMPLTEARGDLVFPYAVVGGGYTSTLTLANVSRVQQSLTITFGSSPATLKIDSNASARISLTDLFQLSIDAVRTDSVRISGGSPFGSTSALLGVLDIESPSDTVTLAARAAATDFTFPYVLNGSGLFTGLAFATGSAAAQIAIDVYGPNGGSPASQTIPVDSNQQISRLLSEFVPATATQIGGYVRIRSDQPIWAWEIYGSSRLMVSGPPL